MKSDIQNKIINYPLNENLLILYYQVEEKIMP